MYLNYPNPTDAKTILPLYCHKLTVKDWKQTCILWQKMSFIPVNSLDSFLPELNKSKLSICLALCCPDIWYPDTHSDIQISLYCLDILISSYTAYCAIWHPRNIHLFCFILVTRLRWGDKELEGSQKPLMAMKLCHAIISATASIRALVPTNLHMCATIVKRPHIQNENLI